MLLTFIPARKDALVTQEPTFEGPVPVASSDCCKMESGAGPESLAGVRWVDVRPVNGTAEPESCTAVWWVDELPAEGISAEDEHPVARMQSTPATTTDDHMICT